MPDRGRYDAANSVRLCGPCEYEIGVGAQADAGDRACAACGAENAPHIYPEFDRVARLEGALLAITDIGVGTTSAREDALEMQRIAHQALLNPHPTPGKEGP